MFYALEGGILDAIVAKNGETISADQIALETKADTLMVGKFLRHIAWCSLAKQD